MLTGHKWFCSAPMSDMFLVLAQSGEGLSCFHVPRVLPDGQRNPFRIQRLKDKLGDRSNASSEVEFSGTWGRMVGEPRRGVPTIIEMVNLTRLDCVTMTIGERVPGDRGPVEPGQRASRRVGRPVHTLDSTKAADADVRTSCSRAIATRSTQDWPNHAGPEG